MYRDWQMFSIADLLAQNVLYIGDGYRAKLEELDSAGLPFARAGNIDSGFHFGGADRFPEQNLSRVGNKVSQPGDVVFTSKGTVGRFALVRQDTPRFVYSPQLCFWRVLQSDRIYPGFLFYWMSGREFYAQYKGVAGQTDMAEYVSLSDQRRMRITLPPLGEQRAIAHILDTLDEKIELNRRMNETLEEMARATFKSWFVDFDPVRAKAEGRQPFGMNAETAALFPDSFEDSPLGEIPAGWRVGKVSALLSLGRETVNPGGSPGELFDHYSIPAYDEGLWPKAESGQQIKSNKLLVPADAVLLSKLNPRLPRVWLPTVGNARRPIASTEFLVAQPQAGFGREYIFALLSSHDFLRVFQTLVTGTSGSHQRVRPESLLAMDVVAPSWQCAKRFTCAAAPLLARIAGNLAESRSLAAAREALLPKLISGEIRLKDSEKDSQWVVS